ncbi:YhjD/YihY/BrkB family envelope integrity protein, partial [Clostridium cochlearium]
FSYYVNNFANYSRVYGSIGAVIVLMVWLYLTSIIIILGGELNAFISIHESIKIRARK